MIALIDFWLADRGSGMSCGQLRRGGRVRMRPAASKSLRLAPGGHLMRSAPARLRQHGECRGDSLLPNNPVSRRRVDFLARVAGIYRPDALPLHIGPRPQC